MFGISTGTQTNQIDLLHGMQLRLEELRSILHVEEDDAMQEKSKPIMKTITFGFNKTQVDEAEFLLINWDSYADATRALVDVIFDKETLANSSISGLSRKGKGLRHLDKLDPLKVNDIVDVVQGRCLATVSDIRRIISKKCSAAAQSKRLKVDKL